MPINKKKINRELIRILNQMKSWIMNTYEPLKRWKHVRDRSQRLNVCINSSHVCTGKIAVYLVFQPLGLKPSTLLTLEHLERKGYSTFLVSNALLMPEDIALALPFCWKIMQRPNFGYDFGGYQDAVLTVMDSSDRIHQLLILNDSIWFPLHHDCDFLDHMEACEAGFVGAFQLEPTRDKNKMKGKKRPFMGSFFWHFKQPVLLNPAFMKFWKNYKATSSKYATIRRGERRFTHDLLDAGITGKGMYSRIQFDNWVMNTAGPDLCTTLQELCTADPVLATKKNALLASYKESAQWDMEARNMALKITQSQNIMATAPIYMVRNMKLPFLKKSNDEANLLALKALNNFFKKHPDAIDKRILNEIQKLLD